MNYSEFFNQAKEKKITNIQITELTKNIAEIEVINKKLENYNINSIVSYNIKAEYNNKTVKLSTDYLDKDIIELIIMKATYIDSNYEDEYLTNTSENNQISLINNIEIDNMLDRIYKLDRYRLANSEVKKLTSYYCDTEEKKRIINSNGVDISTKSHLYKFISEVVMERDTEVISYDKSYLKTTKDDLKLEEYIEEIIAEATRMLTKEKLKTKKYNIILSNNSSSKIISHLTKMISGNLIRTKVSCLENKLNQKVFSNKLTIIEDATNKQFPGYTLFDNEGIKTKKKVIVENGILKTYLYNIKEAKIEKIKSTGNSYGGIGTRNMYVTPGQKSKEELLKGLKSGLYITDYIMGARGTSINTNTGAISLQVFGFVVENGKIKNGFEASVLTTTIFELLNNIEEIADNLNFTNKSVASPDILIKNISISASE